MSEKARKAALVDLRRVQGEIVVAMGDESLPAHVRARYVTEYRQYVTAIFELESAARDSEVPSVVDELLAKRAARLAAGSEAQ